jgi:UPF0716 protein FxsA
VAVLVLLFIIVPLIELYAIVQIGQAIGIWWTIALLLVDSLVGAALMRSQSRSAWRRFQLALAESRVPAREVIDGVLVIFGGALLLTPGFITDVFGLLFMLPPTRAVLRRLLVRRFARRLVVAVPGGSVPFPPRGPRGPRGDADVEGTAHEVDPRQLP